MKDGRSIPSRPVSELKGCMKRFAKYNGRVTDIVRRQMIR